MPVIDYEVEEGGFEPLDEGTYPAVLTEWKLVEKDGKYPYYNVTWTVNDGDKIKNRKVFDIMSLHPKSYWAFKRTMIRLGAPASDLEQGSGVDTDEVIASCVGAEGRIKVHVEDYKANSGETKKKNVVDEVLAMGYSA